MIDQSLKWKKLGDVLCDIGKYLLTVIPFTYFMDDKPYVIYILLSTATGGLAFIIFGIYFTSYSSDIVSGKTKKRKVKVLRNSVFVIEEQDPE